MPNDYNNYNYYYTYIIARLYCDVMLKTFTSHGLLYVQNI